MKKLFILLGLCCFISSCETGKSTDSASLTFEPFSEQAILVPNERSSCSDVATWEVAAAASTTGSAVLAKSVKSYSASWNNMRFSWADSRTLYIAFVQVQFTSPLIESGAFSKFLEPEEIQALLGIGIELKVSAGYSVESANKPGHDAGPAGVGIVNCGLIIGGLKPSANANGVIRGYIKLAGTAIDSFGNEEFIREQIPIQLKVEAF